MKNSITISSESDYNIIFFKKNKNIIFKWWEGNLKALFWGFVLLRGWCEMKLLVINHFDKFIPKAPIDSEKVPIYFTKKHFPSRY